ncbi:peroxiredoxin q [Malassezia pachydermatis]|uniref:thioredoxin-dependent peroxiredoxin n=1 Tax=Malassezia pachydermatis TaxID=77020 RepID=A0A0M8ML47_9BASI|nr:peroxiredoxin q [Malassezia pachydermatis]KOS13748.1 peroxiredoxin q [Malassezia pachydermatis]
MSETTSVPARRQSARLSRKRESEPEVSQPVKQSRTSETKKQDKPATTPTATASPKALRVGDALPDLTLLDQDEKPVKVAELRKAVIFTYPKANTPGCTKQAQCYRDATDDWTKIGYKVFGLSNDAPKSQRSWATKLGLSYQLLSDPKRELIGALTGGTAKTARSHFVIGEDGTLTLSSVGVKPVESSSAALASVSST